MKIKDIFEIETIDDKQYMICLDSNVLAGMVELNETAAYIVECMKSETTIEEIAKKISNIYDITQEEAVPGVESIIQQLRKINAIEE